MKTEAAPILTITEFRPDPTIYNQRRWNEYVHSVLADVDATGGPVAEEWRLGLNEFREWAAISRQRRAERDRGNNELSGNEEKKTA